MLITLDANADRSNVLAALRHVHTAAVNLAHSPSSAAGLHGEYLSWVTEARRQLRGQVSRDDVDWLTLSPHFSALLTLQIAPTATGVAASRAELALPPTSAAIRSMIVEECNEHVRRLQAALESVTWWAEGLSQGRSGPLIVVDTNVFCHHPDRLDAWEVGVDAQALPGQDVHLILPMVVLDELDRQKDRGQGAVATNARHTLRVLDRLLPHGEIRQRGLVDGQMQGAITLDLWPDPPRHIRQARVDDEIIARAVAFRALAGAQVTILTGDLAMSTRARLAGLRPIWLDLPNATHRPARPPHGSRHPALAIETESG